MMLKSALDNLKNKYFHRQRLTHDKTNGLLNFMDYHKPLNKFIYGVIIFLLVIFCMVALIPIFWLIVNAFKDVEDFNDLSSAFFPDNWRWDYIVTLFTDLNFGSYYLVTILIVILAVVFSLVFNGLLAYVTGVLKPKGWKIIHYMIFGAYMIPSILSIIPLYNTIVNIYDGLGIYGESPIHFFTVTLGFGSNAYWYMLLKDYFEKIPESLVEAGRMDGLSEFRIFYKIIIPLSKPMLGVVAIFTMTAAYSDFLLPYLVLYTYGGEDFSTLMVAIFNFQNSNSGITTPELLMAILFSIVPQFIMFLIFQKQIMNGNVSAGLKE